MTPHSIAIRRADAADLPGVLEIERASATAPHWAESEYRAMLPQADSANLRRCLWVALRGEALAGFAVGKVLGVPPDSEADPEAELESVAVRESERRLGLGEALCRAVMQWAAGEGAPAIDLEVRAGSAGAIRLYRRLAFAAVGRRSGYYGQPPDDALVMRCALPGAV